MEHLLIYKMPQKDSSTPPTCYSRFSELLGYSHKFTPEYFCLQSTLFAMYVSAVPKKQLYNAVLKKQDVTVCVRKRESVVVG